MTIVILALIIIINLVIQSTILPYMTIFGSAPNTALIIIIMISLLKGKYYGGFFGLALGLVQDIVFGTVIGVNGLIYFLLGYTFGLIQSSLNVENTIIPVICTASGTIIYNFMYFLFMFFLSRSISIDIMIKKILSIGIIYNSLLSIFIYNWFSKLFVVPSLKFGKK